MPGRVMNIGERTFQFALRIGKLTNAMPKSAVGFVVGRQLLRSGTGIGANVEEAQAAQTKREFTRKMCIALGEAREVKYWLRLVGESELVSAERLTEIMCEADEISRILGASVRRSSKEAS